MLNLTISRSVTYQKIFGFGGAITDSAGFNIYSLSEKTTMNLLNSYFDETGILIILLNKIYSNFDNSCL